MAMWEVGTNEPDNNMLMQLALLFNCSVDYLLGRSDTRVDDTLLNIVSELPDVILRAAGNVRDAIKLCNVLNEDSINVASDYESMDEYGKRAVRAILDAELFRIRNTTADRQEAMVTLCRYDEPAAAGIPNWAGNDYTYVEYPRSDVPMGTDYAVGLSGKSMEPDYPDGCTVFVGRDSDVNNGDVLIVWLEGEGTTCKRACVSDDHVERLESINPEYPSFEGNQLEGMRVFGKVLGYTVRDK